MGIFVCQVWLVPTLSCLNQACAQRLTGNMTQRRAASGRESAAEGEHRCQRHETIQWIVERRERTDIHGSPGRQARERKERASAPTRRDHCAVAGRVGLQFTIVALLRCRLHRSLFTGLSPRFLPHCGRFGSACRDPTNKNAHASAWAFLFVRSGWFRLSRA